MSWNAIVNTDNASAVRDGRTTRLTRASRLEVDFDNENENGFVKVLKIESTKVGVELTVLASHVTKI